MASGMTVKVAEQDQEKSDDDRKQRLRASNGRSGGPIRRILQAIEAFFEGLQFFPCALENLRLDIELFTTDQIELCQSAGEQRTRIFLDVGGWTGRNEGAQTSAEIFKEFRVEHGSHRAAQVVAGSVEFSTARAHDRWRTNLVQRAGKLRYRCAGSLAKPHQQETPF
ncbi:hypothetical protein [Accumulibacter sp.]|jgi:hypothetical protein|uniref:hypothetical protein n=1 Tax=Accumulibacter sp. TaxID=2053492 RepID=UPI003DA84138